MLKFTSMFLIFLFSYKSAFADVSIRPGWAEPDSYTKLAIRVTEGCDSSATVKISVEIPDGFPFVKPQAKPGWKIFVKKVKYSKPLIVDDNPINEAVTEVTWSEGNLSNDLMDEFEMLVKVPYEPGKEFLFPVTQTCENSVTRWIGGSKSKHPAPELSLHRKRLGGRW